MNLNSPVSEIMSTEVITVEASDTIWHVKSILEQNYLNHVPVMDEGSLKGMISKIDLGRIAYSSQDPEFEEDQIPVSEIMSDEPVAIQKSAPIRELVKILSESEFHAVPVLDGMNIAGIVSTSDLIRNLADMIEE